MILPIIAMPDSQVPQVMAMVEYCKKLDGTYVTAIPISKQLDDEFLNKNASFFDEFPDSKFACLQAFGLNHCAKTMSGNPFFWLEPDSTPLKPGWLSRLNAEYKLKKKPFLISSDSNPPHDIVGGIGFYPGDTSWIVPTLFKKSGWDLWLIQNIPEMIERTPLIQHCYGAYDERGFARPLVFPGDDHFVRDDALIFHRDKFQGLFSNVKKNDRNVFLHSGDFGDIIAFLSVIRQIGGGKLVVTDHDRRKLMTLRPMKNRFNSIKPLIEAQPYVTSVEFCEKPTGITHDITDFRIAYKSNRTLAESQAEYIGVKEVCFDPWLSVKPSKMTEGRIFVSRSHRYRNPSFPWSKIVESNRDKIVFCGLDEEYFDFCNSFGHVDRIITPNFLIMAEAIAGSLIFIGNQSSPCWVAMGLGHPVIQESHPAIRDSMVMRSNAQFVFDGRITVPRQLGGSNCAFSHGRKMAA